MKIDPFGPPCLCLDGRELQHSSRKAMALLAYVAMRVGEPVTRQHLADLLWAENTSDQARTNLRQCLTQVRSLLGEAGIASARFFSGAARAGLLGNGTGGPGRYCGCFSRGRTDSPHRPELFIRPVHALSRLR